MLHPVPTLADLVADPTRVSDLPIEAISGFRGELARLDTLLLGRLLTATTHNGHGSAKDHLLTAEQAATKLAVSTDYVYRHAKTFPFTVRLGEGDRQVLRFSENGIGRFIRLRSGR